ncbi:ATP-dependent Clp protease adapter ClpS [Labedella populi]|nr:ATP-dependent Clp protease adapter ClpS [Labedella populi]
MTPTLSDTDTSRSAELHEEGAHASPWVAIVWNDPVNLMSYVSFVFRSYFGYSRPEAERLMLRVHNDGRAVVATGNREEMERHVEAMHGYGLWASIAKADE